MVIDMSLLFRCLSKSRVGIFERKTGTTSQSRVVPEERNGEESTRELVMRTYEDITISSGSSEILELPRAGFVEKRRRPSDSPRKGLGNPVSHKIYEEPFGIADILTYGPINYTAPLTSAVDFAATGNERCP